MDEFELIRSFFAPLVSSPGADSLNDDVALIAPGLIATCDTLVEGVHFLPDDPLSTVARKLVRVNVSDIIAKGGKPDAALLALTWPKGRDPKQLGDFSRALGADLARWGAHLVGGDTTSTSGPLTLTLTMLGRVGARGPVRRSGAAEGQDVWVSGTIGDGWLGLQAALNRFPGLIAEGRAALIAPYHAPNVPRLAMAELVATHASASIDVSDGLVADAGHIAQASGVSVVIEAQRVPLSPTSANYVENGRVDLVSMLTGGDDYQTLFTAAPEARQAIEASGMPVTRIGRTEAGEGVRLIGPEGQDMAVGRPGWTHFSG